MARHIARLIIVLLVFVMLLVRPPSAWAQNPNCPGGSQQFWPLPASTYPYNTTICGNVGADFADYYLSASDQLPCDSQLKIVPNWSGALLNEHATTAVFPPVSQSFPSGGIRLRFQATYNGYLYNQSEFRFSIATFNGSGQRLAITEFLSLNFPQTLTEWNDYITEFDITMAFEQGGYWTLTPVYPPAWALHSMYIMSVQMFDATPGYPLPHMCQVPGIPIPPDTPTPSPTPSPSPTFTPSPSPTGTWNPTATNTPQNTPTPSRTPQTFPTNTPGFGFTPLPSKTPIPPVIVPGENTPTPMPAPDMPGLSLPNISFPGAPQFLPPSSPAAVGLTPDATTQARIDDTTEWINEIGIVTTRWYTSTAFSSETLMITSTTGISTPIEIATDLAINITWPIRMAKATQIYVPNLWPFVLFILVAAGWVFFNLSAKFAIAILAEILELLRKLYHMIPGL
jgi:hypothetical protein